MNLSETTKREQVPQVDIAGVNSIWNSFLERVLNNEEVVNKQNDKKNTSSENILSDDSK